MTTANDIVEAGTLPEKNGAGIYPPVSYRPRRGEFDLYIGGWRVATYKTERGLVAAIQRHTGASYTMPQGG